MLRRQRQARLEIDTKLAAYVTDRLTEGWSPEQIAGRLHLGAESGLRTVSTETIYGWIYRADQKAAVDSIETMPVIAVSATSAHPLRFSGRGLMSQSSAVAR